MRTIADPACGTGSFFLAASGWLRGSAPWIAEPAQLVDYVLTNPPFGKKSSMTFTNEAGDDVEQAAQFFAAHREHTQTQLGQSRRGVGGDSVVFTSNRPKYPQVFF